MGAVGDPGLQLRDDVLDVVPAQGACRHPMAVAHDEFGERVAGLSSASVRVSERFRRPMLTGRNGLLSSINSAIRDRRRLRDQRPHR